MSNIIKFSASHQIDRKDVPYFVDAAAEFATLEEAEAFRALFPKSYRLKLTTFSDSFEISLNVNLQSTKGNGINEGGIKRLEGFFKKIAKNGDTVEFREHTERAFYQTIEDLNAVIGTDLVLPVAAPVETVEAPAAAPSKTCPNVDVMAEDLAMKAENFGRIGVCPECAAFLVILDSGRYRRHARRLKAGNPLIAGIVAGRKEQAAEALTPAPVPAPVESKNISEIEVGEKLRTYGMNLEVVGRKTFPSYGANVQALEAMGLPSDVYSLKCRVMNPDEVVHTNALKGLLDVEDGEYFWTVQGNAHPANTYKMIL